MKWKGALHAALLLVVVLLLALPAFAAPLSDAPRSGDKVRASAFRYALVGRVVAYDAEAGALTVALLEGNWLALRGRTAEGTLTLTLDAEESRIRQRTAPPGEPVPPDAWAVALAEGRLISASGNLIEGAWLVDRLTLDPAYQQR
jgi:hypothetical protein